MIDILVLAAWIGIFQGCVNVRGWGFFKSLVWPYFFGVWLAGVSLEIGRKE